MKCPKCGSNMDKFVAVHNKRDFIYECPICDYSVLSELAKQIILKSTKEAKEGRTYLWCCAVDKKSRCKKSGEKLTICASCCAEQSKKWYRLGKKDQLVRRSVRS